MAMRATVKCNPGTIRISLLGGFDVARGATPVEDGAWQRRRARQLVKPIAVTPTHRLHREPAEPTGFACSAERALAGGDLQLLEITVSQQLVFRPEG